MFWPLGHWVLKYLPKNDPKYGVNGTKQGPVKTLEAVLGSSFPGTGLFFPEPRKCASGALGGSRGLERTPAGPGSLLQNYLPNVYLLSARKK